MIWENYEEIDYNDTIKNVSPELIKRIEVEYHLSNEIFNILENNLIEGGSRCIRVYRDCIHTKDDIYDICLSCSDVLKNGEISHLNTEDTERLYEIKKELFEL